MSQQNQEDLIEIDKRQMYVIQKILKRRVTTKGKSSKVQYFVKWKNYDNTQNTWEPAQNLSTVPEMVEKFQKKLAEKKKQQNSKETNKISLYRNDSEQNASQNSERYQRQNGSKLRKQESGSSRIQVVQQINKEIVRQTPKQSIQLSRKNRNTESISDFSSKNINHFDQEDKDAMKTYKQQDTKPIKQRQITVKDPYSEKNDKQKKSLPKRQESYGKIVNHIYRDDKLYYQVQKQSSNQKVLRIQELSKDQVERSCLQGAYQYLYKLLVSLQQART